MRRTLMKNRLCFAPALILSVIISVFFALQLTAADELLKWRKLDVMDTNFNIIENKAGDDDVLLEMDVADAGSYKLTYYLEDGRQTYIEFVQSYEALSVEYHIFENDGAGGITDVTQTLVASSYLEMNYGLTFPDWEYDADRLVGDSNGLEYIIPRSAIIQYPGVAFEVDNKQVLIKWDVQEEQLFVAIKDYENGKIMPILYESPNKGNEQMKVLKQLEDFNVKPTHYLTEDGVSNIQVSPVALPNETSDKPGSRPGLDVTFKQPKELNAVTWQYDYAGADMDDITAIFELDDLGTDAYLDFKFKLQNDPDMVIENIDTVIGGVNQNVTYLYDPASYEYTLHIVRDKSSLAQQNTFIEWPELVSSSIYDVNVGFEVALTSSRFDDYEFTSFQPLNKLAYTYMAYELKRANVEEAFLNITPFNAGKQEEIEYTILYSKIIKNTLDVDEDLWLKNYHTTLDGDDEIFIPVPFRSTSSQDAYQVVVDFAGVEIYSQVLNYRAVDDNDVPPTTPNINQVDNLFVVPSIDEESTDPERVKFDLAWSAPTNKSVKELDTVFEDLDGLQNDYLYYELSVNDVPTDETENPFETIKVFQVTKETEGYALQLYEPIPGDELGSNILNYVNGYNDTDELFRIEDVTVRDNEVWASVLNTAIDEDTDTYSVTDSGTELDIKFPGINYMRIKAIAIKDGEIANSSLSVPVSLSLSMTAYDVPTVDTLSYRPLYGNEEDRTAGVTLTWHSVDVSNYENYMLSPIGKTIDTMKYTVYIAEEKEALLPLNDNDELYREISISNDYLVTVGDTDTTELDDLRNGKVLYFDLPTNVGYSTDYTMDIQGLDINREYYVRFVTKLEVEDLQNLGNPVIEKRSAPSTVLGLTVPRTPEAPDDQEINPLAPESFSVTLADESLNNALLTWTMPEEMFFEEDLNGFEIFAIEDRSLPQELRNNAYQLTELLEDEALQKDVVEGWRIYVYDGATYLKKYETLTNSYVEKDLNLLDRQGNSFTLIDDANAPNKVNYYYIRTVKVIDEATKSASQWISGAITTAPVKGPLNLTVDYDTAYSYDPKDELVVRFDAPIPEESQIDTDYIVEIHVKGELDSDYSVTQYPSRYLGSEAASLAGYQRISYRITELTPGKSYDIKVRLEDRTKPQEILPNGTSDYPKSPFSDIVRTRTEFDQESYDKENKHSETIAYFTDQAQSLKQIEYFIITSTSNETAVKYRENYATGLIQLERDGELRLYSEDKPINTYYLPSESLNLINEMDVSLVIESKNQLVGIRPDTVGIRMTDEVNEMLDDIQRYTSSNEDYYLRIRVYTETYDGAVNGSIPSSDLVEVSFAVVGSEITEEQMDDRMEELLDTVIQGNMKSLVDEIEDDLEDGIDDQNLLDIVQDAVEDVEDEYVRLASRVFESYLSGDLEHINSINEAITIGLMAEDQTHTHDVYTKSNGSWRYVSSNFFNDHYYVETDVLKPYVTVAKGYGNNNLTELYGQDAVDVVNVYDLSTVFSSFDLSKVEEPLDKYQWVNAVSRLMGASPDEASVDYLLARGLDADKDHLYNPLTNGEALFLFAQAYAYRHDIELEHAHISDYYRISDLNDADAAYRMVLLQGANIGIIDTDNGYISPNDNLTMDKALALLTLLHQGIN